MTEAWLAISAGMVVTVVAVWRIAVGSTRGLLQEARGRDSTVSPSHLSDLRFLAQDIKRLNDRLDRVEQRVTASVERLEERTKFSLSSLEGQTTRGMDRLEGRVDRSVDGLDRRVTRVQRHSLKTG